MYGERWDVNGCHRYFLDIFIAIEGGVKHLYILTMFEGGVAHVLWWWVYILQASARLGVVGVVPMCDLFVAFDGMG